MSIRAFLESNVQFVDRHLGPSADDRNAMCAVLGVANVDALTASTVPASIQFEGEMKLPAALDETQVIAHLRELAKQNKVVRSLIGAGYYDTIVPPVILRNILENPGWYTQYTPYQAEISQGRLEALVNFQTLVADLTGLPLANASLLDEGTAAAEAMAMCRSLNRGRGARFLVASDCLPQTIAVVRGRAEPLGIEVVVTDVDQMHFDETAFGVLLQYPTCSGIAHEYRHVAGAAHDAGLLVVVAADLLALTLLEPPGAWGADVAVGSAQRFGVPLGFGGPHAGYISTHERNARQLPGRVIGLSKDVKGRPAYRLAIQTREQHIRRDKATSNICTAQVLLAIMASMYAAYHGPDGLKQIARRVQSLRAVFDAAMRDLGFKIPEGIRFDTTTLLLSDAEASRWLAAAENAGFNLRPALGTGLSVSFDERSTLDELRLLLGVFAAGIELKLDSIIDAIPDDLCGSLARTSTFLTHATFNRYHSEHEMLRYIHRLQAKDLSLTTSMISLGSCTMKLNATTEMIPVTWPEFGNIHPFAPANQTLGYRKMFENLEAWLAEITGFTAVSLQPNAGSQGEYAGLLTVRAYHRHRGEGHRDVCLIPVSAHGTNPASAVVAGMKVVPVACDDHGNVDIADLQRKAEIHAPNLSCLMVTYPSTHGVFESGIKGICEIVHRFGGQVYMDGANMNAQVGLCRPGDIGADVCHLNLHKTFCIPHGGGGPGMGPICVAAHLAPFLPGHPNANLGAENAIAPISAAPWGSASILPISYAYIAMMGPDGLRLATQTAILNANYMAARLRPHYDVLYVGANGRVAHEFVLDLRPFKTSAGVEVEDVAKRLMDYGFHSPTMSWPVAGTLMIEPTESESRGELDRFCDAMILIREEIRAIEEGRVSRDNNALKFAPHTSDDVISDSWDRAYSREMAAFPASWLKVHKYWPTVGRVDNAYGDRNLVCTCVPMDDY